MKNKRYFGLLIVVLLLSLCNDLQADGIPDKSFTLVIDPGHGGNDPGAIYQNVREKDIVLSLALKLGKQINREMPDVKIIFTRNTDIFIPLHKRAEKAIDNKADLFLSLHANSCPTPSVKGTETFVLGMHKTEENLEVAKKENSVILIEDDYTTRYEGFDPNSSESYIMFDLVQEQYFNQSVNIAALIQDNFRNQALRKDRGVKQAGFLVLRQTSMPSILIETGYLSNIEEAKYLNSGKGQEELAKSICAAIKAYKEAYLTRSDFTIPETWKQKATSPAKANKAEPTIENRAENGMPKKTINTENTTAKNAQKTRTAGTNSKAEKSALTIHYSVQIAVAQKKIETQPYNFKGLKSIYVLEQNGVYKYYYGKESSYKAILQRKKEAQQLYSDAFIAAFANGQQISLEEAQINQGR